MKIDVSPTVCLSVHTTGESAHPVLLVHGWMTSSGVWSAVVPALAAAGFRVITPDLRGTGESHSAPSYTLANYVEDLIAVLDGLGLSQVSVVGHSMGGQICQLLAATRPDLVGRLVLLNPVPASGLPLPPEAMALFQTSAGDRDKQGAILDMACTQLDPRARERLLDDAALIDPHCIVASLESWTAGGFSDRLADITARTAVVATSDPFLPAAFLQGAIVDPIAHATLHLLEGPGHYPQVESPAATATLLTELLTG